MQSTQLNFLSSSELYSGKSSYVKVKKMLVVACAILALSACSKSPQDKFVGKWTYSGSGKLMTIPLKCSIDLEISKNIETKSYTLDTLNLHLTPSVFGLGGGEFFKAAKLTIKDDKNMLTPALPSGAPIVITLNDNNQIQLNPNPCNGITSDGYLSKVK